jgi:hypothetical protein
MDVRTLILRVRQAWQAFVRPTYRTILGIIAPPSTLFEMLMHLRHVVWPSTRYCQDC